MVSGFDVANLLTSTLGWANMVSVGSPRLQGWQPQFLITFIGRKASDPPMARSRASGDTTVGPAKPEEIAG